jgi:uncharacterized protein involved in type VI secretion and phage assembly
METDVLEQLLEWVRSHHFGKYRGVVEDNEDSTGRGRIKVRVPAVLGELAVWAMPCVPYAGAGVGLYAMPDVGTGVWVEFEAGDPSYPVWTGCFWADGELPDESNPDVKIWKTSSASLRIDDKGAEAVLSATGGGSVGVSGEVALEAGSDAAPTRHTVSASGVTSEIGAKKAELTNASFSVNHGALEVL